MGEALEGQNEVSALTPSLRQAPPLPVPEGLAPGTGQSTNSHSESACFC